MFKLNLKIALRNLWRNKGYTAINILGLSVGMACCLLIFLFIRYQTSFDNNFANASRIFRVVSTWEYPEGIFRSKGTPRPLPPAMREDIKEFEKVAAVQHSSAILKVNLPDGSEKLKVNRAIFFAEPELFEIFNFNWLKGNPSVLNTPNTVVLTDTVARTFFGSAEQAIGQSVIMNQGQPLRVAGVLANMQPNSSFPLNIVVSYKTYRDPNMQSWGSVTSASECYVLLKPGVHPASLQAPISRFLKKYYDGTAPGKEGHLLQPLADLHYNADYGNLAGQIMPRNELYGLAVIGIFLILTACINFVNMATAQAVGRSKEVGIRKVMGSRRKELIVQFLTETLAISVLSLLLACVLAEMALPGLNSLFRENLSFSLFSHPVIFVFMVGLVLLVSFLAGFYPALVISGFSPALAIKNKISQAASGGMGLRRVLVVVQFAITIVLIIGTIVILEQMRYVRNQPLGFDTQAVALVSVPNDSLSRPRFANLRDRITKIPGVTEVSLCDAPPSSMNNNQSSFSYNSTRDETFQINVKFADEHYQRAFGLKLAAGRFLARRDITAEYVVNETLLKKLNVREPADALGKYIVCQGVKAPIVGVVRDFNNMTLRETISPLLLCSRAASYELLAVKMEGKAIMQAMPQVEKTWNEVLPEYVYSSSFMDEQIANYYESERVTGTLFKVFAGVIMFISFIGLFGLISYVATQRTRELAIRKVLGASTAELVQLLNRSFIVMVCCANLVAWPLAYLFVTRWLSQFNYRIELTVWPFALAMLVSITVTLATVTLRSYRAAKTNAIDALKYE
ncbi:ABC transporter permease [Pedobacter yulinensis]|uniref:ABC transporter permease n=1 Tax=Pedobacter yulinensis TaxID=2126353 RepID=A0A2T3HM92_9SPHI|nr:ABC transporter permease [Pedobacter yulinensis]PST83533.1 ABC transporter permease [Pedobacter yulinensis]